MENTRIVRVNIKDDELIGDAVYPDGILKTYCLINPDEEKLAELKHMIENRFDYQYDDDLTDEEVESAEKFCDSIWENIDTFVHDNFSILLDVYEYEIEY